VIYTATDWKWARRSAELQRLPSTPAVRFQYAYALPPNFARIANVAKYSDMSGVLDDGDWTISEGQLWTDEEYVFVDYVAKDWSEAQWPSYFVDAVALKLAEVTCLKITHDRGLKGQLAKELQQQVLPLARSTDSLAQPAKRRLVRSPWQEARFGRSGFSNLRRP
jgi:hypothetical protein